MRADQQRRLELPTDDELEDIWKALVDEFGDDHDMRAWGILQEIANEDSDHRVKRLPDLQPPCAPMSRRGKSNQSRTSSCWT